MLTHVNNSHQFIRCRTQRAHSFIPLSVVPRWFTHLRGPQSAISVSVQSGCQKQSICLGGAPSPINPYICQYMPQPTPLRPAIATLLRADSTWRFLKSGKRAEEQTVCPNDIRGCDCQVTAPINSDPILSKLVQLLSNFGKSSKKIEVSLTNLEKRGQPRRGQSLGHQLCPNLENHEIRTPTLSNFSVNFPNDGPIFGRTPFAQKWSRR